eukprot:scaffold907_cov398-Prasinococcus_capsulatus_cf.AAC.9
MYAMPSALLLTVLLHVCPSPIGPQPLAGASACRQSCECASRWIGESKPCPYMYLAPQPSPSRSRADRGERRTVPSRPVPPPDAHSERA